MKPVGSIIGLTGADLSGADLRFFELYGADLGDATLSHADLTDATLRGANLSFADLTDANGIVNLLRETKYIAEL